MFSTRRQACGAIAGGVVAGGASPGQDAAAINKELAEKNARLVHTAHPGAQWYPEAGLGLFVHWGLASVHGSIDLSWGMMHGMGKGTKITPEEYFRLAERFQPDKWAPDRMLEAAKAAGFRYAVLTAKHHEGFALWPSAYGEFNTGKYAGGRDLVRAFVEGCRKHGLKAGLYYSPGDWYYSRDVMSFNYRSAHCWQTTGLTCRPELPDYNTRFEPVSLPPRSAEWEAKYRAYQRGQITELLTRYGKLDLLWFDMATVVMTPDEIRTLQPAIVINNRMGGGTGDFLTPEGEFPKTRPEGWWELCTIWNSPNWGYVKSNEERYAPLGRIVSTLARTRAWGGNLLLNVGPRSDGSMPKPYWDGTKELSEWMQRCGRALFNVTAGGWPESSNTPVTISGRTWYFHVQAGSGGTIVEAKAPSRPKMAVLLRTGKELAVGFSEGGLRIEVPGEARTEPGEVIAVDFA